MVSFRQPFQGDYVITLDYGEKFPPLYTDESPHRGIDYGCPMNTPILASADGYVTYIGRLKQGYGNYIILSHDGAYSTLYAHLSEILVREEQQVKQGQVIGRSGTTGNSTGPHLHFELRKNNIAIDPKTMLQNVIDVEFDTPAHTPAKFTSPKSGYVRVVCDVANARCHCDMNQVKNQLEKGSVIAITDNVTMWHDLPYRDYWDTKVGCWLRIAEHDSFVQMLEEE